MKIGICSLGCKVNIYEAEFVANILKENNYEIVDFEDKADIYIINTCSVTNESDKKSRKMINRARKNNKDAIIIVMGCYSQLNADKIDADIILGNKDKSNIVKLIEEYKTKNNKITNEIFRNQNSRIFVVRIHSLVPSTFCTSCVCFARKQVSG